ncbi:secretin N-terminal domain-containing protein [Prosthecobacter sp.]|uniref:secretin N-terminal domain-containing protein n=1 Tax=Prosthecobacter sp. TaxID=1965333 RepID=UPI002ABA7747|nr:secretin N-terminal domain-containing protein [Prosthecobacter sp.]MDZ4402685.1 secretin N-terminal domain-containing protein [Prosthecobacter sp.]
MPHFPSQLPSRLRFAVLLVLFLLGAKHATKAQQPGLAPTVPVPAGQANAGIYVPVGEGATIKVNFPSAPIQAIIPFYIQLTGKKLILDSALQGEQLRIVSPQMLTKKDAIAFIEATLLLNGYAIINVDATTAKLINHAGGKSPTADGLKVYNSLRDLPESEEICHYVLPLQHISADQASKAFQQVIKLHAYGAMTPISNDSALIITENSATIRSICEIAQIVDVPPAEIANEMIKLERSDVELIAEIVSSIFEQEEKAQSAPSSVPVAAVANPAARPGSPPVPVMNPAGSTNTSATNPAASRVKIFPYRRTNELLVIGRPVDITYIRGLVEKLDKQDDGANFLKRRLKYLDVQDFLPVAYNALAKDTDIQSSDGGASNGGGKSSSSRRSGSSSNSPSTDARNSSSGGSNSAFGTNNNFGSSSGMNTGSNGSNRTGLDAPEEVGAPESMIVGKTLLIADPQSNSLVVSGSPEHIARIDQLLQEMDVRPQQIYISAIIGQLSLGKDYNYGFDFLKLLDDFSVRRVDDATLSTSGSTGSTGALANGSIQFPANFSNFSFNQLNFYGQIGSLSNYIKLVDGNRNFKVLATPSVYAKNAAKSVISSGQRIAVPAQILSNGGFSAGIASTSVSVEYRDVLLKLEVVPLINSDDEVTLKIAQINDNIVGTQTISGNTVPTIGTQELVTEVAIKNGATVVLGGLITERVNTTERGAIFLRRIPILKHLFGTTSKENIREELLIFIQPHIIKSSDPLDSPNRIESGRTDLFHESMQFGSPALEDIPRALPVRE